MGWLIAFGILFLLAILPLGANVIYNADGSQVKIIAGLVRFTVFPVKKKEKKPKKGKVEKKSKKDKAEEQSVQQETGAAEDTKDAKKEKGGSLLDFLPLVQVVLDFLGDFRRKLRLDWLELKLIMAADDPCDLAINYGRAWAALGNLFPLLERAFVIKKRNVEVECDFTASETLIIARLDITITLGRLIVLVVRYGIRALREYMKIMKLRKGGAVK